MIFRLKTLAKLIASKVSLGPRGMAERIGPSATAHPAAGGGTHNAGVWGIDLDPSNRILVTGSEDKMVRVWDVSDRAGLLGILRSPVGARERRGRSLPWPCPRTQGPRHVPVCIEEIVYRSTAN
jgi:WD40 repeat protein